MESPPRTADASSKSRHEASSSHHHRWWIVVIGLVLMTVVNIAHVVRLHSYIVLDSSSTDIASADSEQREAECLPLDKSHVEAKYFNPHDCYTQGDRIAILKQLVLTAAEAFTAHNVTFFLDSGTLLGAYRDKKVIEHDVDADVGVDAQALEYLRRQPISFPSAYEFTVWNSSLYPGSPRDDKLPARLIHRRSGLYLDVFAFLDWTDDETGARMVGPVSSDCFMNCSRCPKAATGGKTLRVLREWIYPLVDCEFEGVKLKCPRRTNLYLAYMYGRNYLKRVKYKHT